MPFWVPVAASGVTAAVATTVDVLTGRRKRAKARRETSAKFRSTFAQAIADLGNIDAHAFMTEAREQHDAAILDFRRFVESRQIESFDAAVQKFNLYRSEVQPAPAKVLASLESGRRVDNSDTVRVKEAINELLLFADGGQQR